MEGQTTLPTPHQIQGWTGLFLDKGRQKKASKSAQGVAENVFKNNLESGRFAPYSLDQACLLSLLDPPTWGSCFSSHLPVYALHSS